MGKTVTYDENDEVVSTLTSTNTITVQFSRKMGRENYGDEEAGLFAQVDVTEVDTPETIEAKVKGTYAFLKTLVYGELGIDSITDDAGVVRDLPQEQAARAAPKRAASKPQAAAAGTADRTAMWRDLLDNPQGWFDNRTDKRNPKAPDFKAKNSNQYDGQGLWLDKAPEFVKLTLKGEEPF